MKRKLLIIVPLISLIFSLSSCSRFRNGENFQNNHFVEGQFTGRDDSNQYNGFFQVTLIDKNEFDSRKGFNVIEDVVINKYFLLNFYYMDEENNKIIYDFINLRYTTRGRKNEQAWYYDDNDTIVLPFYNLESTTSKDGYSIWITDKENKLDFSFNLEPIKLI